MSMTRAQGRRVGVKGYGAAGMRSVMPGQPWPADHSNVRVGLAGCMHDPPFRHDQNTVGEVQDLVQVLADQQHGRPAVAHGQDPCPNLGHCRHVEAEARVCDHENPHRTGEFAGQHRALHVAAGERRNRVFDGTGADPETRGEITSVDPEPCAIEPEAPAIVRSPVERPKREVLDETHPCGAGVPQRFFGQASHAGGLHRGARGNVGTPVNQDGAGLQAPLTGQDFHQLGLPVAGDPGDPDDLAAPDGQRIDGLPSGRRGRAHFPSWRRDRPAVGLRAGPAGPVVDDHHAAIVG